MNKYKSDKLSKMYKHTILHSENVMAENETIKKALSFYYQGKLSNFALFLLSLSFSSTANETIKSEEVMLNDDMVAAFKHILNLLPNETNESYYNFKDNNIEEEIFSVQQNVIIVIRNFWKLDLLYNENIYRDDIAFEMIKFIKPNLVISFEALMCINCYLIHAKQIYFLLNNNFIEVLAQYMQFHENKNQLFYQYIFQIIWKLYKRLTQQEYEMINGLIPHYTNLATNDSAKQYLDHFCFLRIISCATSIPSGYLTIKSTNFFSYFFTLNITELTIIIPSLEILNHMIENGDEELIDICKILEVLSHDILESIYFWIQTRNWSSFCSLLRTIMKRNMSVFCRYNFLEVMRSKISSDHKYIIRKESFLCYCSFFIYGEIEKITKELENINLHFLMDFLEEEHNLISIMYIIDAFHHIVEHIAFEDLVAQRIIEFLSGVIKEAKELELPTDYIDKSQNLLRILRLHHPYFFND
ncbi:hypothetical protein TRFO_22874 [Tritrichomonas foetus]|uniref:Uncharacterized protein n=1 Tax=Tritrichomonas foetus TaxID=1144522 RepID=A0A1J4KBD9_9EUKA|nr:hypothetical protein TRFO_22874 [Tritrichomonas foetus]|eukprot:OHT08539.1 hypothetical protein TRFO_22874 [Tritrichomonas foetus]